MAVALPSLLVVTPTLGRSPWLAETIRSVGAVAGPVRHVLVAPAAAAPSLRAAHPALTVVEETGGGMYAAINAGLRAPGDWELFTYLNDDDVLQPGFDAVRSAVPSGRAAFAYGRVGLIDARDARIGSIPVSRFPSQNRALYAAGLEPVYQHGTVVSRAAWTQIGGYDEHYRFCGDSDFLARLCCAGVPATYVDAEVAAFRLHRGQLTKDRPALHVERRRVDATLGLRSGVPALARGWARVVFRANNLSSYAERVRRHGFVSFDTLLERVG